LEWAGGGVNGHCRRRRPTPTQPPSPTYIRRDKEAQNEVRAAKKRKRDAVEEAKIQLVKKLRSSAKTSSVNADGLKLRSRS
jgi:hypothetical protein